MIGTVDEAQICCRWCCWYCCCRRCLASRDGFGSAFASQEENLTLSAGAAIFCNSLALRAQMLSALWLTMRRKIQICATRNKRISSSNVAMFSRAKLTREKFETKASKDSNRSQVASLALPKLRLKSSGAGNALLQRPILRPVHWPLCSATPNARERNSLLMDSRQI